MGLLAPWFLLALGALGVPLLIHLVRRIRRAPTRFPSLMFLRRFPQREKQRLRLRDPWLLLLRCVALVLLALAFSRPYWASNNSSAATATEGRIVLIALDRSASMQVADYWLVSHALAHGQVVVTHEKPANTPHKVKIPNVCVGLGIKVMTPFEMLRHERARFVLGAGT